ncbi:MAG: C-GCAxxG-C-C family protein [Sphaerochaetaceae bacterium]
MNEKLLITSMVHTLYHENNTNCARTMLLVLAKLFDQNLEKQTLQSAVALHGCGGHRDQCGLVEGAVMFLGIYFLGKGWEEQQVVRLVYMYAEHFKETFGSLLCRELRPRGFSKEDPPHVCEELTVRAITFTHQFISGVNRS